MKSVLVTIDGDDARAPAWRSYKNSGSGPTHSVDYRIKL